jgi:hypothetical protein
MGVGHIQWRTDSIIHRSQSKNTSTHYQFEPEYYNDINI